jgi:uncharacterized protein YdiU (UPF0061 family)
VDTTAEPSTGAPITDPIERPDLGVVLDDSFARDLPGMFEPFRPDVPAAPSLLILNEALADDLGLDAALLGSPVGVEMLSGGVVPDGARPIAQAYSGHQFGGLSPRLGDGRAVLLGEITGAFGRVDLHLKGSGRTPFARGGDGKAAVGPMLREYLVAEAMHALGIPTTRALSVVATGDRVWRDAPLPGAVLARIAASHLRVGTFQFAALHDDPEMIRRVADYAIRRHDPDLVESPQRHLDLLARVIERQAHLVARWMNVGFVHGVMNTDNMTISGETIDYGPCAFLDAYDPATVFSSIDHGGRYAFGNQPGVAQWNLARFAETLLPLIDPVPEAAVEAATEQLRSFPDRYRAAWRAGQRAKLGISGDADGTRGETVEAFIDDTVSLLGADRLDMTSFYRGLSGVAVGLVDPVRNMFVDLAAFDRWRERWESLIPADRRETATRLDTVNPVYVPRNHLVEAAVTAGTAGDLDPFRRLLDAVTRPYVADDRFDDLAGPDPAGGAGFVTFCGT